MVNWNSDFTKLPKTVTTVLILFSNTETFEVSWGLGANIANEIVGRGELNRDWSLSTLLSKDGLYKLEGWKLPRIEMHDAKLSSRLLCCVYNLDSDIYSWKILYCFMGPNPFGIGKYFKPEDFTRKEVWNSEGENSKSIIISCQPIDI